MTYYVRLEHPEFPDKKNPAGLFRVNKKTMDVEAFGRSGEWIAAPQAREGFLKGENLTFEEITEQEANTILQKWKGR